MVNPMMSLLNKGMQAGKSAGKAQVGAGGANPMQMLREFGKFKRAMQGRDPQQILNRLLETGEMTREQLDEYKSMAQDLLDFLK